MSEDIKRFRQQWQENEKRGRKHPCYEADSHSSFVWLIAMLAKAGPAEIEPLLEVAREVSESYSPVPSGAQPSIQFRAAY